MGMGGILRAEHTSKKRLAGRDKSAKKGLFGCLKGAGRWGKEQKWGRIKPLKSVKKRC